VGLIPIHIDTLGLHLSMPPATITSNVCGLDFHPYRYIGITSPHTLEVIMAGGIDRCNPKVSIWMGIKPISIPWGYIYLCHQLLSPLMCVGLIPIHIDVYLIQLYVIALVHGHSVVCCLPTHIRGDGSWWHR
jgi:hypothetical protein